MYACNGILFNHESPRRGETFVTKKITKAVANIYNKKQECIILGNLDAKRDWGYAKDYVEAMWLMLQQDKAVDYVIATGKTHTVREFVTKAFKVVNINIIWSGKGVNEIGVDKKTGKILVKIDSKYFRPSEVNLLCGDSTKAKKELGWQSKTSIDKLIYKMVHYDLKNDDFGGKEL